MEMAFRILYITALAGMGGTGLGGVIGALLHRDSSKTVSLLLSFAAGVMLSVVCFDLVPGAISPEGANSDTSIFLVAAGVAIGFIVIFVLNYLIDRNTNKEVSHIGKDHPKTADDINELYHVDHLVEHEKHDSSRSQLFVAGIVMAAAIALHNLPEGMVIGASFARGGGIALSRSGFVIATVIGLHNIPEGMAVAVPLISGGMPRFRAILTTALSGAPTILGALIGYYLGLAGPMMLALSLSFASGAMLYVVVGELLPEAYLMLRSKAPAFGILVGALIGLILVYV
ncbi:MAG: ZIP family metal transporter [Faecalibacterium sp.]|jgi:ZIP family zinc transporter|nr:ZIP family metal transporter [Faecalibacterium sp.]